MGAYSALPLRVHIPPPRRAFPPLLSLTLLCRITLCFSGLLYRRLLIGYPTTYGQWLFDYSCRVTDSVVLTAGKYMRYLRCAESYRVLMNCHSLC
jgi:hypothetical protein